ncbi:hypothetical protein L6452_43605 [Arctium lappa]|uniref:Uncharacterized protein n=1 Tax=Arctium lappa TaxID=4217 RepID=A0ACB8XH92_ARCLA|nr:hypothetical protein L6452_43605 [Arctium lappa]
MEDCYSLNEVYVNDIVGSSNALHVEDMAVADVNCIDSPRKCLSDDEDNGEPLVCLVNDSGWILILKIPIILFNNDDPNVHAAMQIGACILEKW